MSVTISLDGRILDPSEYSLSDGMINLTSPAVAGEIVITYGFEDAKFSEMPTRWEYGDILAPTDKDVANRRFMYICDDVSQGLIQALTLVGRKPGEIVQEYEAFMRKVDE